MRGVDPCFLSVLASFMISLVMAEAVLFPMSLPPPAIKARWMCESVACSEGVVMSDAACMMLCIVLDLVIFRVCTLKFSGKELRGQRVACEDPTSRRLAVSIVDVCGAVTLCWV